MEKIFNIRYLSRCYVLSTSTTNTNTTLKLKIEEGEYKKNVTFPTSDDGYCFFGTPITYFTVLNEWIQRRLKLRAPLEFLCCCTVGLNGVLLQLLLLLYWMIGPAAAAVVWYHHHQLIVASVSSNPFAYAIQEPHTPTRGFRSRR